jgi:hypothetical protein
VRNPLIAATAIAILTAAGPVSAQELRGFAFAGSTSDMNSQRYPGFGGGVVVDLGQPWLAAGAQGETFFQLPYFTGRGALFAEGRVMPRSAIRPFMMGGIGFGQDAGPMIGAGVEMRMPGSRVAFRLAIEDYVRRADFYAFGSGRFQSEVRHQIATRIGVSF